MRHRDLAATVLRQRTPEGCAASGRGLHLRGAEGCAASGRGLHLRGALRLYGTLLRASLRAQWQYPTDFLLGFGVAILLSASEVVTFGVILWRFRTIGGWGPAGVALLYGLAMGAYALHRLGAGDLHSFSDYVRSGDFDTLLLRPWSPLFALLCRSGRIGQLANLSVPCMALAAGAWRLRATGALPMWALACLPGVLLSAVVLQYAVGIATHAAAFWIVRAEELSVLTINAPNTAAQYPLTVFPGWLRDYLVGVVPVGLCVFFPVRFLLGRGGGWTDLALAPVAAATALVLALWLWRQGERRSTGTGTCVPVPMSPLSRWQVSGGGAAMASCNVVAALGCRSRWMEIYARGVC